MSRLLSRGDEAMKKHLTLSEGEAHLLRGLCYARIAVLKAGDPHSVEELPLNSVLNEHTACMALHVFDFCRSAVSGNTEAVQRQAAAQQAMAPNAGGGYYDGMIGDYLHILSELGIAEDDAFVLHRRIKEYIRSFTVT